MRYKPLSPNFGVEINNIDCSKKISNSNLSKINRLIQEKHFIYFKDQSLDEKNYLILQKILGSSKFILKR